MVNQHKSLYSITEAIRLLGIGRTMLYQEIQDGRLVAVKCGRRTLISAQAIEAWIAALPSYKSAEV
jgi:excisionase family DNA binding protein